jgi:hypothetical protein
MEERESVLGFGEIRNGGLQKCYSSRNIIKKDKTARCVGYIGTEKCIQILI